MSDTFIAHNGVRVTISRNTGCVVATDDSIPNTVIASDAHLSALREYFFSSDVIRNAQAAAYDRAAATADVYHDRAYCPPNPYREESESKGKPGYL